MQKSINFVKMQRKRTYLLFYFVLIVRLISATESHSAISELLLSLNDNIYYKYNDVIKKVDSIRQSIPTDDIDTYSAYFLYFDAYSAYSNSNYEEALSVADRALKTFMWEENSDWEARCLLTMAFTAEALMLDNYAYSYYETTSLLTDDSIIKGIALLGIARSNFRLGKDYSSYQSEGISCLEDTDVPELKLLAKRSYYYLNNDDSSLVSELNQVKNEYVDLGYTLYAAITCKQISYYYRSQEDLILAKEYVNNAIDLVKNTEDSVSVFMSSLYLYYSRILILNDEYSKAIDVVKKSIKLNNSLNIPQNNYYAYQRLSKLNRYYKDYKAADDNSQRAITCQKEINEIKRSSGALLAEILINREYIDRQLNKNRVIHYITLGLFVVGSLVLFRILINHFKRQVEAKNKEVNQLQKDNTVLQNNTLEMLSIVKKLEKAHSSYSASEDFEKRISHDIELSDTLPKDFCDVYRKNISTFSLKNTTLNPAEVRTAVMLAMDIPSKSIAKLLSVENETLKTYRKRIRRKLELEPGEDINKCLKELIYELAENGK